MLSQAGYSSVDEYLENSESSKQSMIKQILIMQALAEKNNIVCDTDILNAEFSRYFGSTDMTSYVNAYGENYVKTNIRQRGLSCQAVWLHPDFNRTTRARLTKPCAGGILGP